MSPTLIGGAIVLAGMLLLFLGSTAAMLRYVMLASMLGGSSAVFLTAIGGSSIPPVNIALLFLAVRCLTPAGGRGALLGEAIAANGALIVFVLYGVIGAFVLPRMFAGTIDVTPLRPESAYIYAASPLRFSSQNITVAGYLLGTMLAGLCGYVVGRGAGIERVFARAAAFVAIGHGLLGFASLSFGQSAFFRFFRNGFYAQVDQSIGGIVRMNGIFAEPAIFAVYGTIWMILCTELWLRGIDRRWSGAGLAICGLALVASTSTSAYAGLGGYALVLLARQLTGVGSILRTRAVLLLVTSALLAAIVALAVIAVFPSAWAQVEHVIRLTFTDKLESRSGQTRLFWAYQGWSALLASWGLGIGAGSFRSSSLLSAIVGSTGVLGTMAFLVHLARIMKPGARRPAASDARGAVAAAAAWTALLMLVPPMISAPSPDPGLLWSLIGGTALALRVPAPRHTGVTPRRQGNPAPAAAGDLSRACEI